MALGNASKVNSGLPQLPEGVPPELYAHFVSLYNAIHNLERMISQYAGVDQSDSSIWNQLTIDDTIFAGNLNRWYVRANEAVSFGQVVSPILVGAELQVRKANATDNTKPAIGIVNSVNPVAAGDFCEVIIANGLISGISGLTAGTRYFLSTSNGLITNVAPVAAGNIEQVVGFALASNRLYMKLDWGWVQH